jgi:hypothetical protein
MVKPGPVPNVGPIAAGVLLEGLAADVATLYAQSTRFGARLCDLLLGRRVSMGEFGKWRRSLDFPISDPTPGLSHSEQRKTFRGWLVFRARRYYASVGDLGSWDGFLAAARQNPAFTFTGVGDAKIAARLYAMCWP